MDVREPEIPLDHPDRVRSRWGTRAAVMVLTLAVLALPVADRWQSSDESAAGVDVGEPPALPSDETAPADRLTLRTGSGVLVSDSMSGARLSYVSGGVPSPDGSIIWRSEYGEGSTHLTAYDAATGEIRTQRSVGGEHGIRIVSWDGATVVLGPAGESDGGIYAPTPRAMTPLVVSGPDGNRAYRLEGNFEPEALGTEGDSLFLISYLPPMEPDRYQVRRLDLGTGSVEEVFTPDEELQQEMGGTARIQAWGPEGRRLYTLYTLGDGQDTRAFVHVLDLDGLWAHCVDLPESFRITDEWAIGMGVAPDGGELYVADGASGQVVRVDTRLLEVRATARIPVGGTAADTVEVLPDGAVVVGASSRLWVLEPRRLTVETEVELPRPAAAVHTRADGNHVAVLGDGRVVPFDAASGATGQIYRLTGTASVRGTTDGGGVRVGTKDSGPLECAC